MHAAPNLKNSDLLCWSRMQAEAGQGLEAIIARKEVERRAGDGLFMWGVGNAPSLAVSALARLRARVPVVFSVMKSQPKKVDAAPARVVAWRHYFDAEGVERRLPENAIVTSRGDTPKGPKRSHYALMCRSGEPLELRRGEGFDVTAYRNAGGRGAPVGASQVTALLRRVSDTSTAPDYEVNLRADLADSYWVRLSNPATVPQRLLQALSLAEELSVDDWLTLARQVRELPPRREAQEPLLNFL